MRHPCASGERDRSSKFAPRAALGDPLPFSGCRGALAGDHAVFTSTRFQELWVHQNEPARGSVPRAHPILWARTVAPANHVRSATGSMKGMTLSQGEKPAIAIVSPAPAQRPCWEALYAAYADIYRVTQTSAMRERVGSWINDPWYELEPSWP